MSNWLSGALTGAVCGYVVGLRRGNRLGIEAAYSYEQGLSANTTGEPAPLTVHLRNGPLDGAQIQTPGEEYPERIALMIDDALQGGFYRHIKDDVYGWTTGETE